MTFSADYCCGELGKVCPELTRGRIERVDISVIGFGADAGPVRPYDGSAHTAWVLAGCAPLGEVNGRLRAGRGPHWFRATGETFEDALIIIRRRIDARLAEIDAEAAAVGVGAEDTA